MTTYTTKLTTMAKITLNSKKGIDDKDNRRAVSRFLRGVAATKLAKELGISAPSMGKRIMNTCASAAKLEGKHVDYKKITDCRKDAWSLLDTLHGYRTMVTETISYLAKVNPISNSNMDSLKKGKKVYLMDIVSGDIIETKINRIYRTDMRRVVCKGESGSYTLRFNATTNKYFPADDYGAKQYLAFRTELSARRAEREAGSARFAR